MITDALILGGGTGTRFSASATNSELPKQFTQMGDAPVFIHAIRALLSLGNLRQIVLVMPEEHLERSREMVTRHLIGVTTPVLVIAGGKRRQDSSRLGLEAIEMLSPLPTRVLIHDACRPNLSNDFLVRIQTSLMDRSYGAWVPVVPVTETLKRVDNHQVLETLDRSLVHRVQTPQVFEFSVIRSLVEKIKEMQDIDFTDDASLCEYYGIPVGVFEGDIRNIKLTYDFELTTLSSMVGKTKDLSCAPDSVTTSTV